MMLRTAKAWGLTPLQWRQQSIDDQAEMMAFEMFESTREAYRDEWREKRSTGKKENHGVNEYEQMKKRMKIK